MISDDQAKAAQEIAKVGGKGIDATREFGGFLNTVFGGGFEELGLAFKDRASLFRYKNMLKYVDEVEAIHKKRKLKGKITPITTRQAIPLLEAVARESDDLLLSMWARLTANGNDPEKLIDINRVHIDILSKFEPLDLKILNQLDGINIRKEIGSGKSKLNSSLLIEDLFNTGIASKEKIIFSLQNLARLGCIEPIPHKTFDEIGTGFSFSEIETVFRLTVLGSSLLEACKE